MSFVKSLFWDPEDVGLQYHPAQSEDMHVHDHCLHLWQPVGQEILIPPKELVGLTARRHNKAPVLSPATGACANRDLPG